MGRVKINGKLKSGAPTHQLVISEKLIPFFLYLVTCTMKLLDETSINTHQKDLVKLAIKFYAYVQHLETEKKKKKRKKYMKYIQINQNKNPQKQKFETTSGTNFDISIISHTHSENVTNFKQKNLKNPHLLVWKGIKHKLKYKKKKTIFEWKSCWFSADTTSPQDSYTEERANEKCLMYNTKKHGNRMCHNRILLEILNGDFIIVNNDDQ